MAKLLIEFESFPAEREAIGQMLIAYGEIEFATLGLVGAVLNDDLDTSARILFRVRGEAARMDVADAIIRPALTKVGLGGKWGNAIGVARLCKNIRNQYAHCHWQESNKRLRFMDLDADAKSPEGDMKVTFRAIDNEIVQKQLAYFVHALDWIYYLTDAYKKKTGEKIDGAGFLEPKSIAAPPLYNPQS